MIVAIDGPAGSGKSTTARLVASRLGFLYLDTGAMYRAIALVALQRGVSLEDEDAVGAVARGIDLDVRFDAGGNRICVDGRDVTEAIRSPSVTAASSVVSALGAVRAAMVEQQRRIAERIRSTGGGVIVDGRDIGTVVFPDAPVKVFLVADPSERARRRVQELAERGESASHEEVLREIVDRDRRDTSRPIAPLRRADDAVEINTTALSIDEQVARVEQMVRRVEETVAGIG